jgi:two-component system sensor histidine kinase BarA
MVFTDDIIDLMNYWGIQKRLLLITLLPCLITVLALGSYFSYDRFHQINVQFRDQATLLSQQLALHAPPLFNSATIDNTHVGNGIESGDTAILSTLQNSNNPLDVNPAQDLTNAQNTALKHYMTLPNLRSISLLDPAQKISQHIGPIMLAQNSELIIDNEIHRFETNNSIRIKAPVFAPSDNLRIHLLGWVEIELNTHEQELKQYTSLFIDMLLILGFCFLAVYMAYKASMRITRPFQQVTKTLNQLGAGNLNARIGLGGQAELNELATGINTMAASLQKARQELQENVEQATEDLKQTLDELETKNIELSMARSTAQKASKTKSEFLANMSHEIRTPLSGILGFSKLLEKTHLNKRQLEYLHTIEASSSSLLSIINDILDFSKIEAGKLVLDSIPMHVRDLTDEVLTMLAPEAHKKGIELAALVYQDVPYEVMGDPVRLKQVLTNLINNAIKFTASGSVIARIMIEEELENTVALKVTVTDTGIGLTDEDKKGLFNAFAQADASTTRRFGGTGLGLVISQYLAEHMHGEIGVDSEAGKGSMFWFTGKFDTCKNYQQNGEETWEDASWFNKHAYVLSNWDISAQVLCQQLSHLGYSVQPFKTLQELVLAQNRQPAELILMDLQNGVDQNLINEFMDHSLVIALLTNNDNHYWDTLNDLSIKNSLVYPISLRSLKLLSQELFEDTDNRQSLLLPQQEINVLAVDDNAPNLELISTWLRDLNINVTQAHGGLQAVQLGTNQVFDLIFMDIQMPDLDGIQATARIREQGPNQATPLIALTAHALANERKNLLSSGFDDYLTKPLSEEQLIHTLSKWTPFNTARSPQSHIFEQPKKAMAENGPKNPILDWPTCLRLSGGKEKLAHTMTQGLIAEAEALLPILNNDTEVDLLLEPIHKLHGLCKYVGAANLLAELDKAETRLKTQPENWKKTSAQLIAVINDLIKFTQDNPDWAQ